MPHAHTMLALINFDSQKRPLTAEPCTPRGMLSPKSCVSLCPCRAPRRRPIERELSTPPAAAHISAVALAASLPLGRCIDHGMAVGCLSCFFPDREVLRNSSAAARLFCVVAHCSGYACLVYTSSAALYLSIAASTFAALSPRTRSTYAVARLFCVVAQSSGYACLVRTSSAALYLSIAASTFAALSPQILSLYAFARLCCVIAQSSGYACLVCTSSTASYPSIAASTFAALSPRIRSLYAAARLCCVVAHCSGCACLVSTRSTAW
mmetsp:Transcript_25565/g.63412  ORF Transcript_25565/g.63412 Transcript_25565/m.63412 type:complete len:266 (+) Transcript_25565:214-1011(+)